jgi:hypothetical protein
LPGYRRPINKEKSAKWKNNIYEPDKTILNDNTLPRHIWAFLSVNKAYSAGSSGMWSSSGLDWFELAHAFGHKEDEKGLEQEVFRGVLPRLYGHIKTVWLIHFSFKWGFSTYSLYFKNANQKFADRTLSNDELPVELKKWGNWHWTRIGFEAIAFLCSIILLLSK